MDLSQSISPVAASRLGLPIQAGATSSKKTVMALSATFSTRHHSDTLPAPLSTECLRRILLSRHKEAGLLPPRTAPTEMIHEAISLAEATGFRRRVPAGNP